MERRRGGREVGFSREARLHELLGYVEAVVQAKGKRRITILVDGETFGVATDELILNPTGPIPVAGRRRGGDTELGNCS